MKSFQHCVVAAREPARYDGGPFKVRPSMLVVHATAGDTAEGAISWLNRTLKNGEAKASYHYIIDRNAAGQEGRIVRLLDPTHIAYHAGRSAWPHAPLPGQSVNSRSIGVAFANDNGSDDNPDDDALTDWQYEAGLWLCVTLCRRFQIDPEHVLGHREVSPGRKSDPLPRILNMPAFRAAIKAELSKA